MTSYTAPVPAVEAHTALRDALFNAPLGIDRHEVPDFPGLREFVEDQVLFVVGRTAKHAHGCIAYEAWRNANDYETESYINADTRGGPDAGKLALGIWTTVAHELAYAVNFINGMQGVSRHGRWHNRKFAEVPLALAANVERHSSLGHVITGPRPDVTQRYADETAAIEGALGLAWGSEPEEHAIQAGQDFDRDRRR